MHWYFAVLKKYAVFSGRAGGSEFWWFTLWNFIIYVALRLGEAVFHLYPHGLAILMTPHFIYVCAIALPHTAVGVRRLHDIGQTGWWVVLGSTGPILRVALSPVLPSATGAYISGVVWLLSGVFLIVLYANGSQPGENRYGPAPA